MGIEPTYPAWKAGVLPLNYTRRNSCAVIGVTGFEPAASWSQTRRSTKLSHTPLLGTVLRAPALNASNIIV